MKRILPLLLIILSISISNAQVGINNPNPDSTSVLDLTSIKQGLLIPRMSSFNRRNIGKPVKPANSLLVYDTKETMLYMFDSSYTKTSIDGSGWNAISPFLFYEDTIFNTDLNKKIRRLYTHPSVENIGIGSSSKPALSKLSVFGNMSIGDSSIIAPINGLFVKGNIVTDTVKSNVLVGFGTTPIGGIIMWSGAIANIPAGWKLCDGSTILDGNSPINNTATPNLKGRFIVGYDSNSGTAAYVQKVENYGSVGNTGGETAHTLSLAESPSHSHGGVTSGSGAHTHTYQDDFRNTTSDGGGSGFSTRAWDGNDGGKRTTDTGTGDHNHTIASSGGGGSHENRPPYFVLAYIMRIK